MAKTAVIREVISLSISCDRVGNMLLVRFRFSSGADACVLLPAHIVFWLLEHLPVNQDPNLPAPAALPQIEQQDWDDYVTPRALSIQCKQFQDALRMHFELDKGDDLRVLMNATNIELMRQFLDGYRGDLMDLGVF